METTTHRVHHLETCYVLTRDGLKFRNLQKVGLLLAELIAELPGVSSARVGGERRSSAIGPSWPNHSTPGMTGKFWRSSMFHSRDIDQIVRKWQIRFSGAKSQGIDLFLAKLKGCRDLATSRRKWYCCSCQSCSRTQPPRGTVTRRVTGPHGRTS